MRGATPSYDAPSSTAARGFSGAERTNAFRIAVGLANLARGAYAVAAGWGLAAEAPGVLVFGRCMAAVAVFEVLNGAARAAGPRRR